MTNEELALLIQAGERDRIPQLWEQVRRFIERQSSRWVYHLEGKGGVTAEDLSQAGFFALLRAVESFDPAQGYKLLAYLKLPLKTEFNRAAGYKTKRDRLDPLQDYISTDAPVGEEEDTPLLDLLADPATELCYAEIEEEDRRAAVQELLSCLSESQRSVIRARYWHELTFEETAKALGVDKKEAVKLEQQALRTLRHPANREKLMRCGHSAGILRLGSGV